MSVKTVGYDVPHLFVINILVGQDTNTHIHRLLSYIRESAFTPKQKTNKRNQKKKNIQNQKRKKKISGIDRSSECWLID
jgi:hypothetical protein